MTQQSNQTHFSRNQRKNLKLDELKNHRESSRMDFYQPRRTFKTQNYSFGYETRSRKIDSRKSMDESYTRYKIETCSRIQQNDNLDP